MKKQEDVKPKKVSKPRKKKEVKVVVEDAPKKEPKKVSKPKTKRVPSLWNKHVSAFYKEKKASNPKYLYKDALKEAKKSYKKPSSN